MKYHSDMTVEVKCSACGEKYDELKATVRRIKNCRRGRLLCINCDPVALQRLDVSLQYFDVVIFDERGVMERFETIAAFGLPDLNRQMNEANVSHWAVSYKAVR